MNSKQELLRRLQQIVSEQLGVQEHEITEGSSWYELGADSLDRLETSRIIENAFDVDIPHQVGEQLNTVGETVDHILNLMAVEEHLPVRPARHA
jgi:acyl carrier protein